MESSAQAFFVNSTWKTSMKLIHTLLISLFVSEAFLLHPGIAFAKGAQSLTGGNFKAPAPDAMNTLQQVAQVKPGSTVLALDPKGLQLVNASTGSTRTLSFGMKEAEVMSFLTNLRGKPRDRGVNQECGAGPLGYATWSDGLTVRFNQGRFVGWSVDGRSKGANKLTMISGIGTGSTRIQLEKVYVVKINQTSLGTEFSNNGFGGLLSGTKRSDRVTNLWSGTTCLFR